MRTLILALVVTFHLCNFSKGQSQEVILFNMVGAALGQIELLSERLQELREELRGEFDVLKGQMAEGCSKQDNLIQIFQGLIEMEVELGKDIVNQTCSATQLASLHHTFMTGIKSLMEATQHYSSREQLMKFQQLLSKDECQEGSNNCSPKATCQDQLVGYKCQCLPGYSGDGFTCTDVDECRSKDKKCHSNAMCTNSDGSFTCSCLPGYSGDGFTCEDTTPPCLPPSALIDGLGCVTPVREFKGWPEAKAYCLDQGSGSRLLEGITSQLEMDLLKEKFEDYSGSAFRKPWIGLKANPWRWAESGDSVHPSSSSSSSLWGEGQPDDEDEGCGYICLECSRPSLWDDSCSVTGYFLCQTK